MEEKDLTVTDMNDAAKKVSDIEVFGDPGAWVLVCKANSKKQGWMKSTKRMEVPGGALYQVETQQTNPDGSYSLSQAVAFVPSVPDVSSFSLGSILTTEEPIGNSDANG